MSDLYQPTGGQVCSLAYELAKTLHPEDPSELWHDSTIKIDVVFLSLLFLL